MSSTITALTSGGGLAMAGDTSGQLQLLTNNGTAAVTIDTSQNVGIGTSSPSAPLTVYGARYDTMRIGRSNAASFAVGIPSGSATDSLEFYGFQSGYDGYVFTGVSGEKMRITSSGNLCVGTTAPITSGKQTISFNGNTLNGLILSESANVSNTTYLAFNIGSTVIGTVTRVGATSAVIYNTTSDQRLKSNIADANPVLDKLMDVKVRQFDWTVGDLHQDAGFIAQELAPVLSGIVTEGKTEEDIWQLDYSRLTPYLVKAIQELNAKVDAQAAEIQALKGVA